MVSTVSTTAAKSRAFHANNHLQAFLKLLVPALVVLTLLFRSGLAHASHFRYGSIAWTVPNPVSAPRTVSFTVTSAWRSSFIDGTSLDFGDGTAPNPRTNGVQIGSGTDANGNGYTVMQYTVGHTYAVAGTYTAFFTDCCRVNGLQNGANGNYRVEAIVDLNPGNTGGPSTASLPIIQMQNGGVRSYTFAVTDPDNDPVTCRFPTSAESGLPIGQTVPSVPLGGAMPVLTSPVNACKMTWDLTLAVVGQQYVVHIVLESTHNGVKSTLAIDLIVEIVAAAPPTCAGSGAFTLFALTPFSTSVTGSHSTGGNSTVSITNGPAGATLQMGPAWPTVQSPSTVHLPHVPSDAQYGSALVHPRCEPRPKSESHAVQTLEKQMGLVPEQVALVSHSTQAPFFGPDVSHRSPCGQSVEMLGLQARHVAVGMSHTGVVPAQTGQRDTERMRLHDPLSEDPATTVV